uniref:GP-PDE domain-containing protein n=1 Tax=Soboliphyme baturini TaxID=241478 RepID=A0A183IV42_9BILA
LLRVVCSIAAQCLLELLVHPPSPLLPPFCPLRRAAADLIGRGFAVWQPYLDVSKVILTLLSWCAENEQLGMSHDSKLPLNWRLDAFKIAQASLWSIANVCPAAFITALSTEVVRFTSLSQHQMVNHMSPLIRSKQQILSIIEALFNSQFDVMQEVISSVGEIVVHCLDTALLKYKNVTELHPAIARIPIIAYSVQTRRIAFGSKNGSVVIYELRAGKSQVIQAHSRCVSICSFSDDGKYLATCSCEEGRVNLWQMSQSFLGMGQSQVKCIRQFSIPPTTPDNKVVALKNDRLRFVWLATKTVALVLPNGTEHRNTSKAVMVAADWNLDIADAVPMEIVLLFLVTLRFCSASLLRSTVFSAVVPLTLMIFYLLGCNRADFEQGNAFMRGFRVGAHRGLSLDAPENTLVAIRKSYELGAHLVELDVEVTADDVVVLMHDDHVNRTTNGVGAVRRMNYSQLKNLNAAAKFSHRQKYDVQRIPTLKQALRLCSQLRLKVLIDVKRPDPRISDTILDVFKEDPHIYDSVAVASFYPQVAYWIRRSDPKIVAGHTWCPGLFTQKSCQTAEEYYLSPLARFFAARVDKIYSWFLHHVVSKITGSTLFLVEHKALSANYIKKWRQQGVHVIAWTVNSVPEKSYFLNTLKCPFLTDQLSDFVSEMRKNETSTHDRVNKQI